MKLIDDEFGFHDADSLDDEFRFHDIGIVPCVQSC
jgi:hypothetical protein